MLRAGESAINAFRITLGKVTIPIRDLIGGKNLCWCVFMKCRICIVLLFLCSGAVSFAEEAAKKAVEPSATKSVGHYAKVDGVVVSGEEFLEALRSGAREKYYHGNVSEKKLNELKAEVGDQLVADILLSNEAKRRKLSVDQKKVDSKLQELKAKYERQRYWQSNKDVILPILQKRVERDELMAALEAKVKEVAEPTAEQQQAFYKDNPDKFTEPEEWNISLIMLKVDPSSPGAVWQDTMEQAEQIVEQIRGGESFEEMARIHSGDDSAANGGNMGYIHTGMLSKPAQQVLNVMEVGDLSEPVMLLQGVSIFRLNGVQGTRHNTFERVQKRVVSLYKRSKGEELWAELLAQLKKQKTIEINEAIKAAAKIEGWAK